MIMMIMMIITIIMIIRIMMTRVAFVCYFAMRSVNRIIKITFLLNFDWMNSLSESVVSTAAVLTTLLSVSGSCVAEFLYREENNMWHIGRSDRTAYLYNLTGTDKLQLQATTTKTTGEEKFLGFSIT